MIESFSDQEKKYGMLFSDDTISGLSVCTSLRPTESSFARFQFDYLPVQAKINSNIWGENITYGDLTKAHVFVMNNMGKGFTSILQLDKISNAGIMYAILMKSNVLASIKADLSYDNNPYLKYKFTPSIKLGMLAPYLNSSALIVFPFGNRIFLKQFEVTTGEDEVSLGFKLDYDKVYGRNNYSMLATYKDGINLGQAILTLKNNYAMELKVQRQVRDNLCCGFNINLSNNIKNQQLTVGWLTKINCCDIHSTISTKGLVTSVLSTELRTGCIFSVSGSLDHAAHDYKLGIKFDWRNPQ